MSNHDGGFLGSSGVKNLPAPVGDMGLIPGLGRFPWKRKWQPTPIFLPGTSHGQRSLVGYSPWSCKESNTSERARMLCSSANGSCRVFQSSLPSHIPKGYAETQVLLLLISNLKSFDFTIIKTTYSDQTAPQFRKCELRACTQDRHSFIY